MSAYTIKKETDIDEADTEKITQNPVLLDSNMPTTKETMTATTHSMEFVLDNKMSFTTVPEITTGEESPNYVLINLQDLQNMVWNDIGTPFLVLSNEKGNMEAKVLYGSSVNIGKTSNNAPHLQSLIDTTSQTQRIKTGKQTSKSTRSITLIKKQSHTESTTKHSLEQLHPTIIASSANTDTSHSQKDTEDDPDTLYSCDSQDCTKKFTAINCKRYHPATHNSQRSLECLYEGCGRKFSWPAHLKYHQLTHTGERQYACTSSGCKKTFYTSQRLAVHMRTHTGEKPFQCQEEGCEKAFTTAGNLKNHIRVHTGERPFVCSHAGCNRSFAEYSSLRKHKLVHTGEKPFVCYECGKTFSQSGSRTVHIKRHHGLLSKKVKKEIEQLPSKENSRTKENSPNIFVLRNSEEDEESLLQYQDFQGSESVVITQDMSDHIVTVTTQPSEDDGDQSHIVLSSHDILSTEVLTENSLTHVPLSPSSNDASVMVVSQPQEIVSLGSGFHNSHSSSQVTDDMVYNNELLQSDLDQKDLSETINQQVINMSPQQQQLHSQTATSVLHSESPQSHKSTVLDPMLASNDDEEDCTSTEIENHS
ncbi:zinc finger protein 26 isoform X1 [Octopus sinensis]|uniref:Zinc finger protein 26 isoform X1 n=1 Tax=Octopus sinensis TaxID=2607531 RepID=A0A6P7SVL7_9MOLL|nr:zinc finger protein 26 isoform X1 [Octopus sinensis]XP_029642314.1 zinc finger protein 26 isoform X1 [Octopus sinensis]XP_029642316.1 zinc finger protein 26 isoform X1 [Octopus sinensis]XP_036363331.1 zinc finger protein 26 isoform X1 [Octopus sinensis]